MEKIPPAVNADNPSEPPKPRRPGIMLKLGVVCASTLLTLTAVEIILRFAEQPVLWSPHHDVLTPAWKDLLHQPSAYPDLAYELKPGVDMTALGIKVRTNSMGMRNHEVRLKKPAGVKRLVVLGDSLAFGWGVKQEATFSSVLEKLLNQRDARPCEVVNMAVSGYGSRDEVALFMHRGARLDPDLVIIAYFLNDPEIDPVQPLSARYQPMKLWKKSHLLRLVRVAWWRYEIWKFGGGDYYRCLHHKPKTWSSVTNAFMKLSIWSKASRVPVALIIFPDLSTKHWPEYPYRDIHQQVVDTAASLGFHVLDLYPVYAAYPREMLALSEDDPHPGVWAHELAAKSLESFLRREVPELGDQP